MHDLDPNRLTRGEQIFGASAVLLFILSLVPLWAKYETPEIRGVFESISQRESAWSGAFNFLTKLALILTIVGVVLVMAKAAGALGGVNLPAPLGLIYVGLGGLTFLLLLLTLLVGPQEEFAGANLTEAGVEVSRGPLLFVGLIVSAVMAAGAYLHMQAEGSSPGDVRRPARPPGA